MRVSFYFAAFDLWGKYVSQLPIPSAARYMPQIPAVPQKDPLLSHPSPSLCNNEWLHRSGSNRNTQRTLCLKTARSVWVRVSALATTGMRLTRVPRRFMISMSRGLRV